MITAIGQSVTTTKGVLTITAISAPDEGGVVTYGYSYTLSAALTHTGQGEINPLSDTITLSVTDATGDSDATPGSLVISIVDDIPVAANDADSVTEGLGQVADGNVFSGSGGTDGNATDGTADVIGADGAAVGGAVTGARTGTEGAGGALVISIYLFCTKPNGYALLEMRSRCTSPCSGPNSGLPVPSRTGMTVMVISAIRFAARKLWIVSPPSI